MSYLAGTLASREQTHRRLTLTAIAGLLLLSTGPVFGPHVSSIGEPLVISLDHLGTLCVTALHLLLEPVHYGFHMLIVVGVAYAIYDRWGAWRLVRRAITPLDVRIPHARDGFWRAAVAAGVDPRILRIVDGLPNPAFSAGWLAPRIYVSKELALRLTEAELTALLAHEGAHVRRRDPLRLSLLRFFACTLFWVPTLRRLAADIADEAEVMADDAAATEPMVLASAILRVAAWKADDGRISSPASTAIGFFRHDLLERRIRRLAGEDAPVRTHVTRRSVLGAALALTLVWSSGIIAAHPLSAEERADHAGHCHHRGESALSHLFCLGFSLSRVDDRCPHADE